MCVQDLLRIDTGIESLLRQRLCSRGIAIQECKVKGFEIEHDRLIPACR